MISAKFAFQSNRDLIVVELISIIFTFPFLVHKSGLSLGDWSTEGCYMVQSENSAIKHCRCNHLTNFAIILDVSQSGYNPLSLRIVTWIGCYISLVGLILTIISFTVFR